MLLSLNENTYIHDCLLIITLKVTKRFYQGMCWVNNGMSLWALYSCRKRMIKFSIRCDFHIYHYNWSVVKGKENEHAEVEKEKLLAVTMIWDMPLQLFHKELKLYLLCVSGWLWVPLGTEPMSYPASSGEAHMGTVLIFSLLLKHLPGK